MGEVPQGFRFLSHYPVASSTRLPVWDGKLKSIMSPGFSCSPWIRSALCLINLIIDKYYNQPQRESKLPCGSYSNVSPTIAVAKLLQIERAKMVAHNLRSALFTEPGFQRWLVSYCAVFPFWVNLFAGNKVKRNFAVRVELQWHVKFRRTCSICGDKFYYNSEDQIKLIK